MAYHVQFTLSRSVHRVPGEKNLLVKIEFPIAVRKTRYLKRLQYFLFPPTYRFMLNEIKEEIRVIFNAHNYGTKSPIAPIHGLVQTSQGLGLLVKRIGPKSGELAPTLKTLANDNNIDASKIDALNAFAKTVFDVGLVTTDLQPGNVVWDEIENCFLIVDGIGERTLIKLRTNIRFIRTVHTNKQFTRLANEIELVWSTKQRKFSF